MRFTVHHLVCPLKSRLWILLQDHIYFWPCGRQETVQELAAACCHLSFPPPFPAPALNSLPLLFILPESLLVFSLCWGAVLGSSGHPQPDGHGWQGASACPWPVTIDCLPLVFSLRWFKGWLATGSGHTQPGKIAQKGDIWGRHRKVMKQACY